MTDPIPSVRLPRALVLSWQESTEAEHWTGAAVDAGVFEVVAAAVHRDQVEPLSDAARSPYPWIWWAEITLPVAAVMSGDDRIAYFHGEGVARDHDEAMRFAGSALRTAWRAVRQLCDGVE